MSLHIYNTLLRKKQEFVPIEKGHVSMYVCGPTVYDYPHIGHAKSYISFDIIVRYLRYSGYTVKYIQNITDVGHLLDDGEDRILKGARREKVEPMELVERYTRAYFEAMDGLNVLRPDISPHAAAHIPEQMEMVKLLLEKGYAYEVNGSVYFDISKWPNYGKLSGRKVEEQKAGARLQVNDEKHHPADFALWKKADPEHIMKWNSPWSIGYPGWHLECSTMAMKYLGEQIDIHGGGMENQFPHHECEIAQSEAATGKQFVNYWIHNNMVLVNGVKMSKSLGNFTTISQALGKFTGEQIRFFILQTHYRSTVDFNDEVIRGAAVGLERIHNTWKALNKALSNAGDGKIDTAVAEICQQFVGHFRKEMNDDFNTPAAIGQIFEFSREINKLLVASKLSLQSTKLMRDAFHSLAGDVLGILPARAVTSEASAAPFIDLLVELRREMRDEKNWAMSDKIRDSLSDLGVTVADGKDGSSWEYSG